MAALIVNWLNRVKGALSKKQATLSSRVQVRGKSGKEMSKRMDGEGRESQSQHPPEIAFYTPATSSYTPVLCSWWMVPDTSHTTYSFFLCLFFSPSCILPGHACPHLLASPSCFCHLFPNQHSPWMGLILSLPLHLSASSLTQTFYTDCHFVRPVHHWAS